MGKSPQAYGANMVLRGKNFDIEVIQKEILNGAKKHIGDLPQDFRVDLAASLNMSQEDTDETIDFEILTEIQHYGGKTQPNRLYNRLLNRSFLSPVMVTMTKTVGLCCKKPKRYKI